jgi:A/G-specific adenine glycosylase
VLAKNCQAFRHQWVDLLPVKAKPPARKMRWFYYFILDAGDKKYWIRERREKDIWENLYEFVLWETGKLIPQQQIGRSGFVRALSENTASRIVHLSDILKQTLTHQTIYACFVHIRLDKQRKQLEGYQLIRANQLGQFPFPGLISTYLKKTKFLNSEVW